MSPLEALEKAISKAERCLGIEILLRYRQTEENYLLLEAWDTELRGRRFTCELGPPSKYAQQAKAFHEKIYRARGQEVFRRQKGLCALCGKKMQGTSNTEIDHKQSRGAHGRDDRMENLRVVHGVPCHQQRHNPPPSLSRLDKPR